MSASRPNRKRGARHARRHQDKAPRNPVRISPTAQAGFDPERELRLKYTLDLPGSPLRSPYPASESHVIVARDEGELIRGIITGILGPSGLTQTREAAVGGICEALGPLSPQMRQQIAYGLMMGTGLMVVETEVFYCNSCGTQREEHTTRDPDTGEELSVNDVTNHDRECQFFRVADREARDDVYRSEAAVKIGHPFKFLPVQMDKPEDEGETVPAAEETAEAEEVIAEGASSDINARPELRIVPTVEEETDGAEAAD